MKRALKWLAVVFLVLALGVGAVLYVAFGRNRPILDGQTLAPGVETVKDGFVSAFVLDAAPGQVALIDCGNDRHGKALLAALQRRGLSPSSVVAIFLTHGHPDHVAGCGLFPGAQVYAMQEELPLLADKVRVTHPLRDGEVTGVGLLKVEAFATPGHTPGSAVYLADGVLFFGDSAGGSKDGTLMPAVRLFSNAPGQNVASLRALAARLQPRAQEVRVLAFAHSGPLDGLEPLSRFAAQ
jgi:glyoxylase-like metal-dependent hydrolase (beta-lactamase superfamily II)